MGDDTWASLFPTQFDVSLPFDSFNTRDLYTVDNGILENLFIHLSTSWKFFVAHFLGVDHVGHTHSPLHSEMAEKLRLMDNTLSRVIEQLPDDAILLVSDEITSYS
jgi:phosphatidylinositol glycan class O